MKSRHELDALTLPKVAIIAWWVSTLDIPHVLWCKERKHFLMTVTKMPLTTSVAWAALLVAALRITQKTTDLEHLCCVVNNRDTHPTCWALFRTWLQHAITCCTLNIIIIDTKYFYPILCLTRALLHDSTSNMNNVTVSFHKQQQSSEAMTVNLFQQFRLTGPRTTC